VQLGPLDGVHQPRAGRRRIPVLAAVGTADELFLEAIQQQDPSIQEIPLDPENLLTTPVVSTWIDDSLQSFGLAERPFATIARPTFTDLRWSTSRDGASAVEKYRFMALADVEHTYPNGVDRKNPRGFVMTDIAWPFFKANPK
jgi:hypothetical protein